MIRRTLQGLFGMARSLKLRLALVSLVVIVAAAGLTTSQLVSQMEARTLRAVESLEAGNSSRLAGLISQRVVGLQTALRVLAQGVPADRLDDPAALAAYLESRPLTLTLFSGVSVVDLEGRVLAGRNANGPSAASAVSIKDRRYFRETVAEARPVISDAIVGRISGDALLIFTMPIERPGRGVVAVMTASLKLHSRDLLAGLTHSDEADDEPIQTVVVDARGRLLAHREPGRVMGEAQSIPGLGPALQRWIEQGRPIEPTADVLATETHVVSRAGVAGTDWVLFRIGDRAELIGSAEAVRREGWQVAALVALGGAFLLALWLWYLLLPLSRVAALAARPDADIDAPGWQAGTDEIDRISAELRQSLIRRRADEKAQAAAMQRMASVLAAAPIGICFTRDKRFELVSREFARMAGFADDELNGRLAREIYLSDEDYAAVGQRVGVAFAAGKPFFDELRLRRRDGSIFWGRLQGRPVADGDFNAGTIWLLEDVTQRRAERERVAWAATHDALTRLHNRESFERGLARALAEGPHPVTLVMIDLDRFKAINDSAGHAAGDQVLRDVAAMLQAEVRGGDLVARLGGDEFAIVLTDCSAEDAQSLAERIRASAAQIGVEYRGRRLSIGASIGLADARAAGVAPAELMASADAACYEAKRSGRDAVRMAATAGLRLVGS